MVEVIDFSNRASLCSRQASSQHPIRPNPSFRFAAIFLSCKTYRSGDLVLFDADEIDALVEMHLAERRLFYHSMVELAFDLHHEEKHVVI